MMFHMSLCLLSLFFFFNAPATTEIYTLSLHDALPICRGARRGLGRLTGGLLPERRQRCVSPKAWDKGLCGCAPGILRSEEHTSELQSHVNLVCRLLLEKKKKITITHIYFCMTQLRRQL